MPRSTSLQARLNAEMATRAKHVLERDLTINESIWIIKILAWMIGVTTSRPIPISDTEEILLILACELAERDFAEHIPDHVIVPVLEVVIAR